MEKHENDNDCKQHLDWNVKAWLAFLLVLVATVVALGGLIKACGVEPKRKVVVSNPPPVSPPEGDGCEDGLKIGDTTEEKCEGGIKLYVCTAKGLEKKVDTCKAEQPAKCYDYAAASAVLAKNCVSCHAQLKDAGVVKQWAQKITDRVSIKDPEDRRKMPPNPANLSAEDKATLLGYIQGGLKDKCDGGNPPPQADFIDVNYIEATALRDVNKASANDQQNYVWLVGAHKINEGVSEAEFSRYKDAGNKVVNALSVVSSRPVKLVHVDPKKAVWRVSLEDLGLNNRDWALIEKANKLPIISQTNIGVLLRAITGKDQPWMHVDNFIDITQRNADVYYALTRTPGKFNELLAQLGINFARDLRNLNATFVGGNQSPISLLKNRLIVRFKSNDGYAWVTFDPVDIQGVRERNLFEFPLLKDVGGVRNFKFDASEVIYTLPNGHQGYALFNAAGVRQNAAPLNIVADNRSPITPEIKNAISCHRCHSAGIIPMTDQIRAHVTANAAQFPAQDVEFVKALYRPQAQLDKLYAEDQALFSAALGKVEVDSKLDDPINHASDKFLLDWNALRTGSFLLLTPAQFQQCINQSATAKAQIGQLLTPGGVITYNQFVEVFPVLVKDCFLFQEPVER